jgi:hypothetical protein
VVTACIFHLPEREVTQSWKRHALQGPVNNWHQIDQLIRIPQLGGHIAPRSREFLSNAIVLFFSSCVFADNLSGLKLDKDSSVSQAKHYTIQSKEKSGQQKESRRHDADLARKHSNSVVGKLVLVKHDLVKK